MNNETVELKVKEHEEKINEHDSRLGCLEKDTIKQETQIQQLCTTIEKLTETINTKLDKTKDYRWLIASILMPLIFFLLNKLG